MDLSVTTAIWLATAELTYEKFQNNEVSSIDDIAFKQTLIQQRAAKYTKRKIDNARISQWTNNSVRAWHF